MALLDQWLSRLRGTMSSTFGVGGTGGVNIKNSGGKLLVRNAADSNDAALQASSLEVKDSGSSNAVVLNPPSLGSNVTFTLPSADGSPGQFLQTNGSGVLSFASSTSNAEVTDETPFDETSGTLNMFTPPANAYIRRVKVIVDTPAGGGSPTFKLGVSGTLNQYMDTTDNDLKTSAMYETQPEIDAGGTPAQLVATIVASAQTFSGRILTTYVVPS